MTAPAAQRAFAPEQPRHTEPGRVFAGLDLGTMMGWALVDDTGRRIDSGIWRFERVGKEHPGARYVRASQQLAAFLRQWHGRLSTLGYELVRRHEGTQAAHVYGAFEAILLAVSAQGAIAPDTVEVADLKTVATGRGNAKKLDVMVAARSRWPELDIDGRGADNEADALWLADIMRRRVLGVRW